MPMGLLNTNPLFTATNYFVIRILYDFIIIAASFRVCLNLLPSYLELLYIPLQGIGIFILHGGR